MNNKELYNEFVEKMKDTGYPIEPFERLTCANCTYVGNCLYAWDSYNTNGDCLADK